MRIVFLMAWATVAVGCARYEYNIVEPPDLTRHIGKKSDEVVAVEPLEYRFRTADNRLVMRIYNPTDDPIHLLGDRSTVVDPHGQSHPLLSVTIAPQSFVKFILPPYRPRLRPYYGPTIGIGVGTRVDAYDWHRRRYWHYPYDLYDYDIPRYFAVYDGVGEPLYWEWTGEGLARLTIVFRRGDREFQHRFVFRRQKM